MTIEQLAKEIEPLKYATLNRKNNLITIHDYKVIDTKEKTELFENQNLIMNIANNFGNEIFKSIDCHIFKLKEDDTIVGVMYDRFLIGNNVYKGGD